MRTCSQRNISILALRPRELLHGLLSAQGYETGSWEQRFRRCVRKWGDYHMCVISNTDKKFIPMDKRSIYMDKTSITIDHKSFGKPARHECIKNKLGGVRQQRYQ